MGLVSYFKNFATTVSYPIEATTSVKFIAWSENVLYIHAV